MYGENIFRLRGNAESSKNTTYALKHLDISQRQYKGKEVDLEQGIVSTPNSSERIRRDIKQQFRDTFHISTKGELSALSHPDEESNEQKAIVKWLKEDVLSVPPDREEKIRQKINIALEQWPVTSRLLKTGLQKQAERDLQVARYGETAISMGEKVFGSDLSSIKKQIATNLNEPRTRLAHLLEEKQDGWFKANTKPEREDLEQKIEKSNVSKAKTTRVRMDALKKYGDFQTLLAQQQDIPDVLKQKELSQFAIHLEAHAMDQINAIKAANQRDSKNEELKTEQHHTTHGVGLGNLLHVGEMLPGYTSLALSALAEKGTAQALSKQL